MIWKRLKSKSSKALHIDVTSTRSFIIIYMQETQAHVTRGSIFVSIKEIIKGCSSVAWGCSSPCLWDFVSFCPFLFQAVCRNHIRERHTLKIESILILLVATQQISADTHVESIKMCNKLKWNIKSEKITRC